LRAVWGKTRAGSSPAFGTTPSPLNLVQGQKDQAVEEGEDHNIP
jgi:hypothetical protein